MRKDGAEKKMFMQIWENSDKRSEISGKLSYWPGHYLFFNQFGHLLSKGAYPSQRLNPENIMLMTPEEHQKQESFPAFIERRDQLKAKYYQESPYSYSK